MPVLDPLPYNGRIPTGQKLRRHVETLLGGRNAADHVIALTDVYTGTGEFRSSADAKGSMREWVGAEPRFHPHCALHDFEAWLLPYWPRIKQLSGTNRTVPGTNPENVNHGNPPSRRLAEAFRTGGRRSYVKARDARRILDGADLTVAANACIELKAFLNTILTLSGGDPI